MPIYPENFVANSLSGTILVTNGFANVTLPTNPFALEGDKNFVIRIRKGGINGLVIATSPTITVRDPSQLVSLTANVSTVAEGNLVSFTLVTANAADNSNVFYSILPVTANVNTADFVGANVGRATIINNQATFSYFANADYSLVDETGETFRVQLRENSPTGNIIYTTSNVAITDFYKRINVFRFEESSRSIVEGTSVTFTISAQNLSTGTLLYYYTSGNADITGSNTGSIAMNSVSNTITISTSPTVPTGASRSFNLILSETNLGTPIATSNAITVIDSSLAYLNATGGTISTIDGFRIHTFTSSGTFAVSNFATAAFNTANVLLVAGGGGGGKAWPDNGAGGGGGGGGFLSQTEIPFSATSTYNITVGAGGTASVAPSGTSGSDGSNSSITADSNFANIIAVGGGGGGARVTGTAGRPGGSGGGGHTAGAGFGFPSPTQQGFPGGSFLAHPQGVLWQAGGGAGGAGIQGSPPNFGIPPGAMPTYGNFRRATGGPGANSDITGANVTYAGGGGGGMPSGEATTPGGAPPIGDAGVGGGGWSGIAASFPFSFYPAPGVNGTVNRGGGGGAGGGNPSNFEPNSPGGGGGSGIVIIRYPWVPPAGYVSATANSSAIAEGTNAFFVVNTTFANNSILYYDTLGNVTSASFVGGNTGSFVVTGNTTVVRLQTTTTIPQDEERMFALRIREDSATTGNIRLVSSNVFVYDSNISANIAATGGSVTTSAGFRVHTFTTSGNFVVNTIPALAPRSVEYIVVAGGGAGGYDNAGGGGAGGFLTASNFPISSSNTYVVTVGGGGSGFVGGPGGGNGSNSSLSSIIAIGGGGGGSDGSPGKTGGSGGGGASPFSGGSGTPGQGNSGGAGSPLAASGGGGGGASQAGIGGSTSKGGDGSPSLITGANVIYAGGGGGTRREVPGRQGGAGGGGTGGQGIPGNEILATSGTDGTGGGGGGGSGVGAAGAPRVGGNGGSGIVIIRYPFA